MINNSTDLTQNRRYTSIPFWSWNNDIKPSRLIEQMHQMKSQGINGFIIHARRGLKVKYLGEEWFDCIDACLEAAEQLNMDVWVYDDYGWPSGFAGGKLLDNPQNHIWYLEYRQGKEYHSDALAAFIYKDNKFYRVESNVGYDKYYLIYARQNPSYVDILNKNVVEQFIDATHEEYYRRFKRYFGRCFKGFFTDEPQYYRTGQPWSPVILEEFKKRYGYDVRSRLIGLFEDTDDMYSFRNDYWKLVNELLMNNYQKILYDWCTDHGCMLTGHTIEESSLSGQMMCCAGAMTFYEYEHIPGIDCLSSNSSVELSAKQCSSVAQQLGKNIVLSETFAACGWGMKPKELKRLGELQYVNGINCMCQHLFPYSIQGFRKRDYPPFFSYHNPWMKYSREFNEYFNVLGYKLSHGKEYANTLVIHPMRTAYCLYRIGSRALAEYDREFMIMVSEWRKDHLMYHFGDETLLSKYGSVKNGKIILGDCSYENIILPSLITIDSSTAALMKEFLRQGGNLCILGNCPTMIDGRPANTGFLKGTISYNEILSRQPVSLTIDENTRQDLHTYFFKDCTGLNMYMLNSNVALQRSVKIRTDCAGISEYDLNSDTYYNLPAEINQDGLEIELFLQPYESKIIRFDNGGNNPEEPMEDGNMVLENDWTVTQNNENSFTLDRVMLSYNGVDYGAEMTTMQAFNHLLKARYTGPIFIKYSFNAREVPDDIKLVLEPDYAMTVLINGNEVANTEGYRFDPDFKLYDILPFVKKGSNEIIIKKYFTQPENTYHILFDKDVKESLKNCINFTTEIENAYLVGKFGVFNDTGFIRGKNEALLTGKDFYVDNMPSKVSGSSLVQSGFPFFAGNLQLSHAFEWHGEGSLYVQVDAMAAVVKISVNGHPVKDLLFSDKCEITSYVRDGENMLELTLVNSNRNLMGPFHHPKQDPYCVGPEDFGENDFDETGNYIIPDQYAFEDFGLRNVKLIQLKKVAD